MIKLYSFLCVLLLSRFMPAQYSPEDFSLIQTTFLRTFEPSIIDGYLSSDDPRKQNAALLTIAHSSDTSFVPSILAAFSEENAEYSFFALGALGPNGQSADFLLKQCATSNREPAVLRQAFTALGKTGSVLQLKAAIELYSQNSTVLPSCFSLAVYEFFLRSISDTAAVSLLCNITADERIPLSERMYAIFCLYRMGGDDRLKEYAVRILGNSIDCSSEDEAAFYRYYIGALRRMKFFPADQKVFFDLLSNSDLAIRVEAIRVSPFYQFTSQAELTKFLSLLNDPNPSVSRETAIALSKFSLSDSLLIPLKLHIRTLLSENILPVNAQGELFKALCILSPAETAELYRVFSPGVTLPFRCAVISLFPEALSAELNNLMAGSAALPLSYRMSLLESVIAANVFRRDSRYDSFLLQNIALGEAPLVTIASDAVDSTFFVSYKDTLSKIIISVAKRELNNSEYAEALPALSNLAARFDSSLAQNLFSLFSTSSVYSIAHLGASKLGLEPPVKKSPLNLQDVITAACSYSGAVISTTKGDFQIEFLPGIAPISTGSFCLLALRGYFDGTPFHRVVPGFVIQGGDSTATGWGGPGYEIISEYSPYPYTQGVVGMGSSGKDTEGSQWFVMQAFHPHLNGRYSVFAMTVSGIENVLMIDQDDKIERITLFSEQ